jgi:hypothetical protein
MYPYHVRFIHKSSVWIRTLSDPELTELIGSGISFPDLDSLIYPYICTFYAL